MGSVDACASGMLYFVAVIALFGFLPGCVVGNVVNGPRFLREPVILPGQCETNLPSVANLDLNRYEGRWYEVESFTNGYLDGDCIASDFEVTSLGVMGFYSTQVYDRYQQDIEGSAIHVGNGQFVITLVSGPSDPVITFDVIEYRVLATDYDSYALGYSCTNIDAQTKRVYSWKLSRNTELTEAARLAIDEVIAQVDDLDNSNYIVKDHSALACYIYPPAVQGQAVVMDGQCPSIAEIPIVQNFDLERYQGIWYDIESYYNSAQDGECVDADFLATENGFTITGSQVLNRNLVNNYGAAYLVGSDGSARFELLYSDETDDTISFETTEYWVLATDYESYSLIYSCSNVSPTTKAVFAWKHSRTRALSDAAQTEINAVMEDILELDNRFFFPKSHAYEECFYYPEPTPNQIVTFRGECQNVSSMQNFNVANFLGTWSEISSYPTGAPSRGCVSYELSQTDTVLSITRSQVIDGEFTTISGNIEWIEEEGRFSITFNIGGNDLTYPFWIIDTDYETYAVGYSCVASESNSERKEVYSWKFGRDRILPASSNIAISQAIAPILALDERYYATVDQSGVACLIPIFPIQHEGSEIIFSGRCEDTNIPIVQNFNFNRFQGEWYDIALYYNPAQTGECNEVQYTIESDDVLQLLKTQVVNGTQIFQTGKATRISTDGSAVFFVETANANEDSIISFVRSEYYVVATDYESYALLYSCMSLDDNQRRIYSWKQSRTRQVTAAAEEAMNNVIAQIDILDDLYFDVKDHSDEACLIVGPTEAPPPTEAPEVPEIPVGSVNVFPGQCDDNIPVVLDIDLERYQGTWYDIEMYFNNRQTGECTAADYDYNNEGVLNFTNTQVLGGLPTSQTGVATLIPSADGSAKFEVAFANTDEDSVISFARVEYWILATDYDSYSLVYSCVNQFDNTMIVYSWKQSRTRQLTDAARDAINAVVAQVDVLDDQYFQVKDHSDEACLIVIPDPEPEPEPTPAPTPAPAPIPDGSEVIFPGQCNDNIPVALNIDLDRYQGTWYDIEMYFNNRQTGECTAADYDYNNEGVLNFTNTQVLGGLPTSQTGVATLIPSADGSARFEVSFANTDEDSVISFARVEYWILATDYDSYSLVYSCVNQPDNTMIVYSWKQSRTRQLTDAAREAIDAVVATIEVLDNQYFQVKDHSDEACLIVIPDPAPEPEPEPTPAPTPAPIPIPDTNEAIFEGQCDDNIPVVLNFDLNRYQGFWYDIEMYYNTLQTGQCTVSEYLYDEEIAPVLFFNNTQVMGGIQTTQTGIATLILSADGSAKFVVNLANTDDDSIISFARVEYWILATDYDSYSLVYSCVNLADNRKRVYSWKQSRTNQLTDAAREAIDAVVQTIDVLDDQYFEVKDHSEAACLIVDPFVPSGGEIVLPGQCEDEQPAVLQNYDPIRYLGEWYEVESYPDFLEGGSCKRRRYGLSANGLITLQSSYVANQSLVTVEGSGIFVSSDGSGRLFATYNIPGPDGTTGFYTFQYWILATDYDSYSFAYACQNVDANNKKIYSWKMSRTPQLTAAANTAINAIVNQYSMLNNDYYTIRAHSDALCFFYPPIPAGQPIIIEGQCSENVPAVTNLDIERYAGSWFNIESYYMDFLGGTCGVYEHNISGEDNLLVSVNQVVNQELNNVLASLVPSGDSGRFEVYFSTTDDSGIISFGVGNFYVLATDYDSYSLGYSCINVSPTMKQLGSWKLSRTQELTPAANVAIDAVVNSFEELHSGYYTSGDQSDEGCFFYPELVPGEVVTFTGQCDDNIVVVDNFDITRFQGIWNDISSYPTQRLDGSCVTYEFSSQTNTALGVGLTQIFGGDAVVNNGTLTRTGGDSKFSANLNIGGNNIVFPFWILDTDYDNYALAYSCINLSNNSREVYSWKLGREKVLSAPSNNAINLVQSVVDVLDDRYYGEVDQSDDSCLILPVLGPNEPVILNGQCSSNINAVPNFNIQSFQGVWYSIEQYYSEFLDGECNQATVFVAEDGRISVVKTSVANGVLNSGFGTATIADPNQDGTLDIAFILESDDAFRFLTTQVQILATDYNSYALMYACENLTPTTQRVYSWKFSRSQQLSAAAQTAINAAMNQVTALDDRYYSAKDHSEAACSTTLNNLPGDNIIFSGQCNPNIPVVQNFDAARYMGLWFDIESYPERFQFGTCPTATYNLNEAGFVEVYNTQVVDRNLDEINGTAVVASDDGSAKLTVTFPIFGTNLTIDSPYWVLATDYDNYALVYSCINLDTERYQVTSWKLSRETTLSAASQTAINQVVNAYPVLDNRFYNVRGHSNSDCLYYPENNGGPVILPGTCEPQNTVLNFDADAFTGTWYEESRYPSQYQTGDCASTQVQVDDSLLTISYSIVDNGNLITLDGLANAENDDGSFYVAITNSNGEISFLPLSILATDYTSYALLHSCRDLGNQGGAFNSKQVFSWKLSRSREGLSSQANQSISAIIENVDDLNAPYYRTSDQGGSACLYYPEFGPDADAIILPGTCSETIQAVPNFNAAAYLGLWFEISSYPVPSQDINAQCSRADYSLGNNGVVDVFNTLVINQTLDIQTGVAVVASTDGSGILDVTFVLSNGAVVNANYYIMATDYNNYALVYSCRNVGEFSRQVSSWVLSRERTLANQYYTIINPVIDATEGLLEDYYRPTSQSDEDCFYIPELDTTSPVIFNGQCEDVTGVQGFDIARYAGWWHEVEAYPTGIVDGTCTSSRIQSSNNQYLAVDTTVFGLGSNVTTSTLTAGTNGRIVKTSNGVSSELWVLATDYETYSVLYSCENINAVQRRVWSAIHSKTRTLSPIASLSIQETLASNQVLISDLYVPVDQTDDGCFHYPEITGDRVIIPGQCDNNIPVVQNFDVAAYGGTWYQIEKYPQQWESGTCVGARYSLDEATGVVDVLNWEVIDGVLDEIEGTAVLISTDGSAKLLVTLPVVGTEETTTFELFVLTTDYESYSLAYSCENVNQYERSIGAWKLSRSRTLAAADAATINNVITQRPELHAPYFLEIEQNDDCDMPSSGHVLSSSLLVIFFCALLQRLY